MHIRTPRILRTLAAPVLGLTLLAGAVTACGSDDGDSPDASAHLPAGDGATSYPVTLETGYGSTTLEERPDRIVTYNGLGTELALSLGITPVASGDWEQFSSFLSDFGADDIDTVLEPVDGNVPLEAISAAEPDLIVVQTPEQKDVDQLAKIAPVLAYDYSWEPGEKDWQGQLADLAEATDLASRAEEVVQTHGEAVAAVRDEHPEFADHSANFISDKGGSVYVESYGGSPAEEFFSQLGFRKWEDAGDYTSAFNKVSPEKFGDLGADVIFVYDPSGEMPTLDGNRIFDNLPAVKADRMYRLVNTDDDPLAMTMAVGLRAPAPLTDAWLAEHVAALLGDTLKDAS